jgi:hypothetical protein
VFGIKLKQKAGQVCRESNQLNITSYTEQMLLQMAHHYNKQYKNFLEPSMELSAATHLAQLEFKI